MRVFDLRCEQGHLFEGWFGSDSDYEAQQSKGYLTCPVCGNAQVLKMLSAPRINLGKGSRAREGEASHALDAAKKPDGDGSASRLPMPTEPTPVSDDAPSRPQGHLSDQASWIKMARALLAATEDVGTGFADEARRIHEGQAPERVIRGHASSEERQALREEGIPVMELVLPPFLKETLQ
jgi:hypothetical protein